VRGSSVPFWFVGSGFSYDTPMTSAMNVKWLSVVAPIVALSVLGAACSSSDTSSSSATTLVRASSGGCASGTLPTEPLLDTTPDTAPQTASYSTEAVAPQSKSCDGMRDYLSTPQPGWDLQSYVFFGHLKDSTGRILAFSTLNQRQDVSTGTGPATDLQVAAVTANSGDGIVLGGIEGAPDQTVAVSQSSNPFDLRSQSFTAGAAPQYIDARVVEGQLGQPGAVIELTAQVQGEALGAPPTTAATPMQISVRLRDVGGVGQWGYGPSGFFPQWIYPNQRQAITDTYGGSVEKYLAATNDPMTGQGDYYYSSPVLEVESFSITENGSVVASGTEGELIGDYVDQSFDAKAAAIVGNGVEWTEFTTLLDGGRTMKVGTVTQSSVGTLPYAVLIAADGTRAANGSLEAAQRWNIDGVQLTPDPSAVWKSPRSGKSYATTYTAELKGSDGTPDGSLTYTAVYPDQELDAAGRTVYEGLFAVTGTIGGKSVTGYAWAEIQPSGTLG
jgi:hypothetical protein